MISHKHKCIFIHIPRSAGTSLENWLCGSDWWDVEKETKHLIASQAKKIYSQFWDEYFTFSFVRNPWDRVVSGLKYADYFGVYYNPNPSIPSLLELNFDGYKDRFGTEISLEHDHRFYRRGDLISDNHLPGQIYGNIIDEQLDYIGRFETLQEDCRKIQSILGIEEKMTIHNGKSQRNEYREYYNQDTMKKVERMYSKDIEHYGFEF